MTGTSVSINSSAEETLVCQLAFPVSKPLIRYYDGLGGGALANIPTEATPYTSAQLLVNGLVAPIPVNRGDNYSARSRGYIRPTVTGTYTIWISSDDAGFFSLGAANASTCELAISVSNPGYSGPQGATGASFTVALTAGVAYPYEMGYSEGGGGDYIQIDWSVGGSARAVVPAAVIFAENPNSLTKRQLTKVSTGGVDTYTAFDGTVVVPTEQQPLVDCGTDYTFNCGHDFWRTTASAKPDGIADTTDNIQRNGNVGINTNPLSTHDVAGSVGHNITSTAAAAYTALFTDYTINLTLAGAQAVTLPAPATCTRRLIILRNATTAAKSVSSYTSFTGAASTSIPANTAIGLQSDGTQWLQVSLDSAILPTVFFSVQGASGQTVALGFNTLNLGTVIDSIGVPAGSYAAGIFTIPITGIYQVTGTIRWADSQVAGTQYGVGVHTSNIDGAWFLWSAIENTTTTTSRRTTYPYTRVASFTAGQQIRMFSYVDGPAMPIGIAAMQVLLIA